MTQNKELLKLALLVKDLRESQKEYFKLKKKGEICFDVLAACRSKEFNIDKIITEITQIEQFNLFDA